VKVPCRCVIGRSSIADIRLGGQRASSEHAHLGWYNGQWVLRDLGSSNGTTVDGRLLAPKQRCVLERGNRLCFGGDAESWTVVGLDEPDPCAVLMGPQKYVFGKPGLLFLPSPEVLEASIFVQHGRWRLDAGATQRSLESGDIITLPSGYWRLLLTNAADDHLGRTAGYDLDLSQLELVFDVRPERVALTLRQGSVEVQLPARACVRTLLALAQQRIGDRAQEPEAGWVSSVDLSAARSSSEEKINVDIHRLRKMFEEAHVRGAANIVERDDFKRLRIGVSRIVFTP